jgi:hypothetical protein
MIMARHSVLGEVNVKSWPGLVYGIEVSSELRQWTPKNLDPLPHPLGLLADAFDVDLPVAASGPEIKD